MNDVSYIFYSLKSRLLNSFLSVFLTAVGVSIALIVTQFGNHIQERISKDGEGIDIVVGAKGSPLQLILSSIYHIDIPTGNISYEKLKKFTNHPQVKTSIPLALGDNWKGYRIVGTSYDYISHYNVKFDKGKTWDTEFEVVVGSDVDLELGDEIVGSHGLLEGGTIHQDEKYKVVGVLKQSNTVLDRLILTSIESVLMIHGYNETGDADHHNLDHKKKVYNVDGESEYHHAESEENHDIHHDHGKEKNFTKESDKKITALLIITKSPVANMNLPRLINKENSLQAANPAIEITRLTSMLGLGSKSFAFLSFILIVMASLSIFSGLAATLDNRMGDLAILRAVGYSKIRIFKIICLEGTTIVIFGILSGILMGMITFSLFIDTIFAINQSGLTFRFNYDFFLIILAVFTSGLLASIIPAYTASKISVAIQLSKNV